MSSRPTTPRSSRSGRVSVRPRGRHPQDDEEPPLKKRKYVPGGPGGGGRFVLADELDGTAGPSPPRPRSAARRPTARSRTTTLAPRERSTRARTSANRSTQDDMEFSSAAAVAAAVAQSEGYKPREERGWEEFHPNLDIEATFMVFHSEDVDGTRKSTPPPPAHPASLNGANTPSKTGDVSVTGPSSDAAPQAEGSIAGTPSAAIETPRRRTTRPRDAVSFYATRSDLGGTPKTPKVLSTLNQTPKERLDLKLPSYRKTDRILLFESKTFGQAKYVEKAMMNVGYQESDNFIRPDRRLLKASDAHIDEDVDQLLGHKAEGEVVIPHSGSNLGRVEYDMDEQDDMWLEQINAQRKLHELEPVTREIFEITITKIEKEWHALEKKIPKPNPKPPQTHRPRSSSAVAVNGENQAGEEQDSKCAICDDGDCENTNAIVFCDGCDLAVHQECYGVPFIPEGQWMCRKCQLAGRGIPTCIFCPNTDGAFKQTNNSKWAHLLCAMWIPEVSLGNHTFMEPVMDVDKVPKNRWKLQCYICNQKMGACIQCGNKACYQAFHVTCARRAHLFLKMKNSQGALAVLDGGMVLKAFCDKHCPPDHEEEHGVKTAIKEAKKFYRRTMKGRIWASSQDSARQLAATHRHHITEHPPDESQMIGAKLSGGGDKKKGQTGKIWKLPSGAPVIPLAVFDLVESGLARFTLRKRKEYVAEACRYWTLKRESRRGAALLKRLQLQMESFSSIELTRRDFAAMGPSGKSRLARRIEFAEILLNDLEQLKSLTEDVVGREWDKLEMAELEQDFVDTCYFPVFKLLVPVIDKAQALDKGVFKDGLIKLQDKFDKRLYTTTLAFAHDLCEVINVGINTEPRLESEGQPRFDLVESPTKPFSKSQDRKRLGKRIIRSVQSHLEMALKAEADLTSKPYVDFQKELEGMIDASLEIRKPFSHKPEAELLGQVDQDIVMAEAPGNGHITVAESQGDGVDGAGDKMDVDELSIEVKDEDAVQTNGKAPTEPADSGEGVTHQEHGHTLPNGVKLAPTPPDMNEYTSISQGSSGPAPLTPPQSNGSFGRGTDNMLTEGGIPWYLKPFDPVGTTAIEEQWAGRDAVRSLSEELTDMDEAELNDLELNVEDSTITASPVNALPGEDHRHLTVPNSGLRSGVSRRKLSNATASASLGRKRLRSSGRRR